MQPAQGNPIPPSNPMVNPAIQPSVAPPIPPMPLNSASPPVPPPPPSVQPSPAIVAFNPAYGGFRALNEDLSAPKVEFPTDFSKVKPGDETSFHEPIKLNKDATASSQSNPPLSIVDDQLTTFGSSKSTFQGLITQTLTNAQFAWDEAKKGTDPEFVKRAQEAVGKALENDLTSILGKEYKPPTPEETWK